MVSVLVSLTSQQLRNHSTEHSVHNSQPENFEPGAGRRFKVCTQAGFLNVHSDPSDPFRTDNVVNQLMEGEIVESVGPPEGDWEQHDGGGWSVRVFGGFEWLRPIE
mmetsp:Transcript_11410/g.17975  ORF Transcript_11410/g.17975 Transcript_11410/m.17975 type:complete len:106 (-) Transcript_11410:22-339(-)